jgi:hypothetical protein
MKPTRNNKMLGIAVGEKSMLVAEVHATAGQPQVVKTAEFRYPEGQSLKDVETLGAAFNDFLKAQDFSARTALFGLPAKWIVSKAKEVPAVGASLLADTLRLRAPMEFSADLGEMIYDYANGGTAGGMTSVLLVAVPKKYVDQIAQFADVARVKALAVMPFSTALGVSVKAAADSMMLLLGPSGVEFTSQQGGNPKVLRYVGASADATRNLVGELRRQASSPGDGASQREIFVWNDSGIDEAPLKSLEQSLGVRLRDGQTNDMGVQAAPGALNGRDFAAAISLAAGGIDARGAAIDFLDSRLAPVPVKRINRQSLLAIITGVVAVLGLILWAVSLHSREGSVVGAETNYENRKVDRLKDQATVAKIEIAKKWHGEKPRYVACIKDLTECVKDLSDPSGNNTVFFGTNFTLSEDDKGQLTGKLDGKSTNETLIFGYEEKLKGSKHFDNVRDRRVRDSKTGEITYTIEFVYYETAKQGK